MSEKISHNSIERPPVIAIMGHIDHGKSSLLDYIRKSNIVGGEAGGITQHIGAYEVVHEAKITTKTEPKTSNTTGAKNVTAGTGSTSNNVATGKRNRITFLDTPGHAAFKGIRTRGADTADIAVLVVSGEEGVKPQTVEALQSIQTAKIPYIVAITKIDSPKTDLERIKQNLAENEIYLESYGGQIPWLAVSSVTGEGISELLDLLLLQAELGELRGDPNVPAEGVVIEANLDKKKGVSATLIIKNGTLRNGMAVVCASAERPGESHGTSIAPVRLMEDWNGKRVTEATFSSPINLIGFDNLPKVGEYFVAYANKKEAERALVEQTGKNEATTAKQILPKQSPAKSTTANAKESEIKTLTIPLVLKADASGSLEAIEGELKKINLSLSTSASASATGLTGTASAAATAGTPRVALKLIQSGIGDITENDVKTAAGNVAGNESNYILVVGFNNRVDPQAKAAAERMGIEIHTFDIIYKLVEWIEETMRARTPKMQVEETTGKAKILKLFSKNKDKQVLGGRVIEGTIVAGAEVRILRREAEIGQGKIRELQQQKSKASEAKKDTEFGALIESRVEIAPGDQIQSVQLVTK